jgi:hypothetical protein
MRGQTLQNRGKEKIQSKLSISLLVFITSSTSTKMTVEENKTLVKSFIEDVFNKHNLMAADKYIAAPGRERFKQMLNRLFLAFPDIHGSTEHILAEDNLAHKKNVGVQTILSTSNYWSYSWQLMSYYFSSCHLSYY